jgi:hypothetical protein
LLLTGIELLWVTMMTLNMIYLCSRDMLAFLQTLGTPRILCELTCTDGLPSLTVVQLLDIRILLDIAR